ncbi:hypothetical protein [Streptomyces sp. P9-A4]|uniref:hypothetical protein n=1 Tax=Streptomyces sp. P9-A4 TaxID=3072285 RepID=UPI002FC7A376
MYTMRSPTRSVDRFRVGSRMPSVWMPRASKAATGISPPRASETTVSGAVRGSGQVSVISPNSRETPRHPARRACRSPSCHGWRTKGETAVCMVAPS